MAFSQISPQPVWRDSMGPWQISILGAEGLRINGPTSFHLDEGPRFAHLNIYRVLADGAQLEVTREREATTCGEEGDVVVRWEPSAACRAHLSVRYRVIEEEMAVDATFAVRTEKAYGKFELFIANYFTPYYTPGFALRDNRAHPESAAAWYRTKWNRGPVDTAWPRDAEARAVFQDGRWLTGYPLNWEFGADYALPLMTQRHQYGHAVVLMARSEDCIGLSGLNSYHNSQYFHLFGRDLEAGESLSTTVRMAVLTDTDHLDDRAVELYGQWRER